MAEGRQDRTSSFSSESLLVRFFFGVLARREKKYPAHAVRLCAGLSISCPCREGAVLSETDDIDEADAVEPDGDAADNALGIVPVFDGLEGDVVDDFEVFGFEAEAFLQGVHLVEGAEGVHHPQLDGLHVFKF